MERDNTIIITCVNGEKAIEFDKSDYKIFEYTECSESRVGRILPPYITMIQQKSAAYLVREGTFPIPSELLKTI